MPGHYRKAVKANDKDEKLKALEKKAKASAAKARKHAAQVRADNPTKLMAKKKKKNKLKVS